MASYASLISALYLRVPPTTVAALRTLQIVLAFIAQVRQATNQSTDDSWTQKLNDNIFMPGHNFRVFPWGVGCLWRCNCGGQRPRSHLREENQLGGVEAH